MKEKTSVNAIIAYGRSLGSSAKGSRRTTTAIIAIAESKSVVKL